MQISPSPLGLGTVFRGNDAALKMLLLSFSYFRTGSVVNFSSLPAICIVKLPSSVDITWTPAAVLFP